MAEFAVSNRVVVRSGMGRFISECEAAGAATAKKLVEMGADISRDLAPVGSRPDMRAGHIPIAQSIETKMLSSTSGVWQALSAHALHQEFGTTRHDIIGSPFLRFFWENAGRMWVPGLFGEPDIIDHPGHEAQPFLRPAYKRVMAMAMAVARREYPG